MVSLLGPPSQNDQKSNSVFSTVVASSVPLFSASSVVSPLVPQATNTKTINDIKAIESIFFPLLFSIIKPLSFDSLGQRVYKRKNGSGYVFSVRVRIPFLIIRSN